MLCLSTCEVASCGDGLIQAGVEGCDDGDLNSDTAACLTTCEVASSGDGLVQAGVEQCDGGAPDNGMCQACELACDAGFEDCNMDAVDGCEVDLCGGTCDAPGENHGMKAYNYTGQIESFDVPACVKALTIEAWGAQGGDDPPLLGAGGKGAARACRTTGPRTTWARTASSPRTGPAAAATTSSTTRPAASRAATARPSRTRAARAG